MSSPRGLECSMFFFFYTGPEPPIDPKGEPRTGTSIWSIYIFARSGFGNGVMWTPYVSLNHLNLTISLYVQTESYGKNDLVLVVVVETAASSCPLGSCTIPVFSRGQRLTPKEQQYVDVFQGLSQYPPIISKPTKHQETLKVKDL